MRCRAARVDANQAEIVRGLREFGVSVQSLAPMGDGVSDLLCGWHGANYLLEIKTAKGKLTADEAEWIDNWRGQVAVVRTLVEALDALDIVFQ